MNYIFKSTRYFTTPLRLSLALKQHKLLFGLKNKRCLCHITPHNPSLKTIKHDDSSQATSSDSPSSSSSSSDEYEQCNEERELNSNILKAALPFVKTHGWTTLSISKGAESLGYSSMVHGMFTKGGIDLVNYFYSQCNSRLEEELKVLANSKEKKKSTTEFIRNAVEIRLRMNTEYLDSWHQALALHFSPKNFPRSLNNIGVCVDHICYYAGDRSFDFNWYTKRGILVAVYKSTEICMLQDRSEDFQDTWAFLDRRLSDLNSASKCVHDADVTVKNTSKLMQVGLTTALNILGLNGKSR